MAFKTLFLAHAPDADKEKHRSMIDTGKYKLFCVVVKTQDEAIQVFQHPLSSWLLRMVDNLEYELYI